MFKTGINEYKRIKTSVANHLDRYTIIKTSLNQYKQRRVFLNRRSAVRIRPAPPPFPFRFSELGVHARQAHQRQNPDCSKIAVVRRIFLALNLLREVHAAEEGVEAGVGVFQPDYSNPSGVIRERTISVVSLQTAKENQR